MEGRKTREAEKKISTRGVTFRIPDSVVESLEEQAKKRQISLNILANQIFKSYVEWDVAAVDAGWMVFPKPALKKIFDKISEKDLDLIARQKAEYHRDIMLLMRGSKDIEGFLALLRQRCSKSGFPFSESKKQDGAIQFIVQHDMGEKWSSFNKVFYVEMINHLGYKADVETTKNTLVLKISRN